MALALLGIRRFPPIALLFPFYLKMRDLRLLDSYTGLILSVFKITFVAWFMRGFFAGMPQVLEEAAWVNGGIAGVALGFGVAALLCAGADGRSRARISAHQAEDPHGKSVRSKILKKKNPRVG
ncbi:MAG: hypothetical protein ACUVRV_02785 [Cyanobacteriota bacterium]